ncbi:MAG: nitroreductase [Micromonosporaceae bacterium]
MNPGETSVKQHNSHRMRATVPELPAAAPDVMSALSTAALVALRAPSVHQTQPWHWRIRTGRLELYADHRWQPPEADPDGRLLGLSCGAALHHVRTALRAMGCLPSVCRIPDSGHPDLLAEVTVAKPIPITDEAVALVRATSSRRNPQGPPADNPTASAMAALRRAAAGEGIWLHLLRPEQVRTLLIAAEHTEDLTFADPGHRRGPATWSYQASHPVHGLRGTAAPSTGNGQTGNGHRSAGGYGILYGSGDRPLHWLRAGEALSAVWLTAIRYGLATQPLSSVTEAPAGRSVLRHLLSGVGNPYLAVRIGIPHPAAGSVDPRQATA